MSILVDDKGTKIKPDDRVCVLYIDRSRGAEVWMREGVVVGIGRSRVLVKFPSRTRPQSVGHECLRVIP